MIFGSKPVDFEAQIAEINASTGRRLEIMSRMAQARKAGERISSELKAKPKKKITLPKTPVVTRKPTGPSPKLKAMLEEFYAPPASARQEVIDPWEEDAKFLKGLREKIAAGKKARRKGCR